MTSGWIENLTAYPRPNGRKGIRNLVAVLAAADNVNPLVRQLALRVPGVVCLPASYGRGQMGRDFEVSLRAMAGLAAHPNVAECLVVSFEPESSHRVAERAEKLGRRVHTLSFLDCGGLSECLERGGDLLRELCEQARHANRVPLAAADLVVGLECGGSDTTSGLFGNPALGAFTDELIDAGGTAIFSEPVECLGGEELLRKRATTASVAQRLTATVHAYDELAREHGVDLAGTNPTPDNLAGGLTSIEEKSLGALAKTGSRPMMGVLDYAQSPPTPGVWMMDAPAAAVENVTALAAGGAQLVCFVTGTGNPTGHPVSPTLKITANSRTMARMAEHIDVDLTAMLHGGMNAVQGAQQIAAAVTEVVNGGLTSAERLQYLETNISRLGPSV
jgi:altronate dehydratase large subunit